jgi:predicted homoserine dehydrogenase-like protein
MGTDIVSQVALVPTQEIVIIADIELSRARAAYEIAGQPSGSAAVAQTLRDASRALLASKLVATADFHLVTDVPQVEAIVEATGSPEVGARAVLRAISQGKHVVVMNVETDVTIGPILRWYADRRGVIYTVGAGDEPTALYELYEFAESLGLTIIAAGKGKNNPLDQQAMPEDVAEEARRRGLTPEMLVEFIDGSKTQIEMAAFANATGLVPDVRGMHGPKVKIADMKNVLAPKEQGGILGQIGVVEYVIGDLQPGVFLVFSTDKPRLRQCLVLRDMGQGPNYLLLRPFHLCSMEIPLSVARAVVEHTATMAPGPNLVTEVLTVAKKDLPAGTILERIGGHTHYGLIDRAGVAKEQCALPIGLAKGATAKRPIAKGEVITCNDVQLDENSTVLALRRLQDAFAAEEVGESELMRRLDRLVAEAT